MVCEPGIPWNRGGGLASSAHEWLLQRLGAVTAQRGNAVALGRCVLRPWHLVSLGTLVKRQAPWTNGVADVGRRGSDGKTSGTASSRGRRYLLCYRTAWHWHCCRRTRPRRPLSLASCLVHYTSLSRTPPWRGHICPPPWRVALHIYSKRKFCRPSRQHWSRNCWAEPRQNPARRLI